MKGTKLIAGALVSGMMLTGAGYAYWTDQVTVANTVSTGEFEVGFVNEGGYPKIFGHTNEAYLTKSITHDPTITSVTVGNMYPGSYVRYETKIKNNGSIPAVFDVATVNFDSSTTEGLKSKMKAEFSFAKYDKNGDRIRGVGTTTGYFSLDQLQSKLNEKLSGVRLEPGESISFDVPEELYDQWVANNAAEGIDVTQIDGDGNCIAFRMPTSINNDDNLENATAKFDIQIKWKQHNQ
ncbi:SipW-dependent-type signal peptide-containing protein [Rossellomorea sp. DUT-2]|uniref:SipW-dependent-type signal peptide-containing protein n=1 Tax=Rossellomorea sp. DUT-2 TaxID=3412021 RepID=UPI003D184ABE